MKNLLFLLLFFFFCLLVLPLSFTASIHAQIARNNLETFEQRTEFEKLQQSLVCLCGCNFVLKVCPHVECPWGIPIRSFIEYRILNGEKAEDLLIHFEQGFGEDLHKDPFIIAWSENPHTKRISNELAEGYGKKVLAHSSIKVQLFLFILIVCVASIVLLRWWRKNQFHSKASRTKSQENLEKDS